MPRGERIRAATLALALFGPAVSGLARSAASAPDPPIPPAAGGQPSTVIRACARLATGAYEPLEHYLERCPDLGRALASVGLERSLSAERRAALSAATLEGLAVLASRYQRTERAPPLDEAALRAVLARLESRRDAGGRSLWDEIVKWIEARIGGRDAEAARWLDRWLSRLGSAAYWLGLLTYLLMGLVPAAAAYYVYRELRSAHPGRGVRRGPEDPIGTAAVETLEPELESVPMLERPSMLLRQLIVRLAGSGRLPGHRHLTRRELGASVRLGDPDQIRRFAEVADLAERIRYGAAPPSAALIEHTLQEGRALLASIGAASVHRA